MLLYALRRLIYLVPVAFGVSLLVFALVHLAPGDPISAIVPPDASKEVVDKLKEYYGFDKPLPVQYIRWLTVTLSGDFGTSIGTGRPVVDEVSSAFGNTIILAIAATLLAFSLAIFLGTAAAYAKSRAVDPPPTSLTVMLSAPPPLIVNPWPVIEALIAPTPALLIELITSPIVSAWLRSTLTLVVAS